MKGLLHEAAELRSKRGAAIIEAETKYQQMDPQQLIALLQLDKQAVQIRKGGNLTKQITVTKGSELAALVKKFPDWRHFSMSSTWILRLLLLPSPSSCQRGRESLRHILHEVPDRFHGKSPPSSSRRPSKGKGKSRNDGCVGTGKSKGKGKKCKERAASRKHVSSGQAS